MVGVGRDLNMFHLTVGAFYLAKMACASRGGCSFPLTTAGISTSSPGQMSTLHKPSVRPQNSVGFA